MAAPYSAIRYVLKSYEVFAAWSYELTFQYRYNIMFRNWRREYRVVFYSSVNPEKILVLFVTRGNMVGHLLVLRRSFHQIENKVPSHHMKAFYWWLFFGPHHPQRNERKTKRECLVDIFPSTATSTAAVTWL